MNIEFLVLLAAVAVVATALGFLLNKARTAARHAELQQQNILQQRQLAELQNAFAQQGQELQTVRATLHERETRLQVTHQQLEDASQRVAELGQVRADLSAKQQAFASEQASLQAERRRADELKEQLQQTGAELRQQRDKAEAQAKELAQLRTSQQEKEEHFAIQLRQLDEQKVMLKKEFENLANQILEAKGKTFSEQSRESLGHLLKPFREQVEAFRVKVEDIHHKETQQQAEMRTELRQLQSMHQQMTQEAHNLSTALHGQKKMQGNWGELILENVLDRSGLQQGKDYRREVSFTTDEGRYRPDVLVYLPDGKHLVIDAKVSLNAYTRYVNSEDDAERPQALAAHVQAFASRIKELSQRDYYKLPGLNSPEMVFMFVPIESAFVEALKADETLFQKALEQNVLVATPTTLLTSLNIVRQLWRFEDQNKHTAELADKAGKVYEKLASFIGSMEGVGKALERARDSYDKAYAQLYTGRGNLIKQASEFRKLGVSVKSELSEHLVERAELELSHAPEEERIATGETKEIA